MESLGVLKYVCVCARDCGPAFFCLLCVCTERHGDEMKYPAGNWTFGDTHTSAAALGEDALAW